MSETPTNGNGAANGSSGAAPRQFSLRQLYVKDLSFEAPNSPAILSESGVEPEIKLNLRTSHREVAPGFTEVVLHVSVHAVLGQRTIFLVELEQAAVFQIAGFPVDEMKAIVGIACPNALFPYAREAVSSLVQKGGFAPLVLQPIDFTALFSQAQSSRVEGTPPVGDA